MSFDQRNGSQYVLHIVTHKLENGEIKEMIYPIKGILSSAAIEEHQGFKRTKVLEELKIMDRRFVTH